MSCFFGHVRCLFINGFGIIIFYNYYYALLVLVFVSFFMKKIQCFAYILLCTNLSAKMFVFSYFSIQNYELFLFSFFVLLKLLLNFALVLTLLFLCFFCFYFLFMATHHSKSFTRTLYISFTFMLLRFIYVQV